MLKFFIGLIFLFSCEGSSSIHSDFSDLSTLNTLDMSADLSIDSSKLRDVQITDGSRDMGEAPQASFTTPSLNVFVGAKVQWTDTSSNSPTRWNWSFEGGTPNKSDKKNPTIQYNDEGVFEVELEVENAFGKDLKKMTIHVEKDSNKISILIDSDANHGVDDQNAIAYAIFRQDIFEIKGMVSNSTPGTSIRGMHEELEDMVALCGAKNKFPLAKGPPEDMLFDQLKDENDFEGKEAMQLIIDAAKGNTKGKLLIVSIGKATNTALAIYKDPAIKEKIAFHMVGTDFPEKLDLNGPNSADKGALKFILNSGIEIFITPAYTIYESDPPVRARREDMESLKGKGPQVDPVRVRSLDESFERFGDWVYERWQKEGSVLDFKEIWDLGALAPLVDPSFAKTIQKGAPDLEDGKLVRRPDNPNTITIRFDFRGDATIQSLLDAVRNPQK